MSNIKILPRYETVLIKDSDVEYDTSNKITSPSVVFELAKKISLDKKSEEELWLICLDIKGNPIGLHMVSRGTHDTAIVSPREIFQKALLNNAHSIICMHNHPSGNVAPSTPDMDMTTRIVEAGEVLGIKLLDHIIIGETYYSLKEKGLL